MFLQLDRGSLGGVVTGQRHVLHPLQLRDESRIQYLVVRLAAVVQQGGAVVAEVNPTGAAAGLLGRGDVILSINGVAVSSVDEVSKRLASARTGSLLVLRVWRGGEEQAVPIRKR